MKLYRSYTLTLAALIILSSGCTSASSRDKYPFYAYGEAPGEDPELIRLKQDDEVAAIRRMKQMQDEMDHHWRSGSRHGVHAHRNRTSQ